MDIWVRFETRTWNIYTGISDLCIAKTKKTHINDLQIFTMSVRFKQTSAATMQVTALPTVFML